MNMIKTSAKALPDHVEMTAEQWANVPDNPRQRDTENRAKRANYLLIPMQTHAVVSMAILPDGREFKLDGHTRSYMWQHGMVTPPKTLTVTLFYCATIAEVTTLYSTFDSASAVEKAPDRVFGAYREHGFEFKSPLLKSRKIVSALRNAYRLMHGHSNESSNDDHAIIGYFANELQLIDECNPDNTNFPSTIFTAAIITLMRDGPNARHFWTKYSLGHGWQDGERMDAVLALRARVNSMRLKRQQLSSNSNFNTIFGVALSAYEAYGRGFVYTDHIKSLGASAQAEFAKKAAKTRPVA